MSQPTIETETTAPDHHGFEIIVNAEQKTVTDERVSYEQVTELAFPGSPPDTTFQVNFRKAKEPKEGSLSPGRSVVVHKEGTIFNVKNTGRS